MAAQAPYTLTDAETTPINHVFANRGVLSDPKSGKVVATWKKPSAVNAEGDFVLKAHYSEGVGANGVDKITYVLTVPFLETVGTNDAGITPPAQKAYEMIGVAEFRLPRRTTAQQRKNLVYMMGDLVTEAVTRLEVENRDFAF
jgi:hypothetical protein